MPTTRRSVYCACNSTGQVTAQPRMPRNSRRLMSCPHTREGTYLFKLAHLSGLERCPCPLWVKSRHRKGSAECPLYPQKRTSELSRGMSAFDPKRTLAASFCCGAQLHNSAPRFRPNWLCDVTTWPTHEKAASE